MVLSVLFFFFFFQNRVSWVSNTVQPPLIFNNYKYSSLLLIFLTQV